MVPVDFYAFGWRNSYQKQHAKKRKAARESFPDQKPAEST